MARTQQKLEAGTDSPEQAPADDGLLDVLEAHIQDTETRMQQVEAVATDTAAQIAAMNEQMKTLLTILTPKMSPAKGSSEPAEMPMFGENTAFEISHAGTPKEFVGGPPMDVDSPAFKAKMEIERFMNQIVTIKVHQPANVNEPQRFCISNNGRAFWFGGPNPSDWDREYKVPRYVVAQLAQTRPFAYRNEEYTMSDGSRSVRWPRQVGLRYVFSVTHDPAGERGTAWLRETMRRG